MIEMSAALFFESVVEMIDEVDIDGVIEWDVAAADVVVLSANGATVRLFLSGDSFVAEIEYMGEVREIVVDGPGDVSPTPGQVAARIAAALVV